MSARARRAAGLGADFAKLGTANAVSNVGDGITRVAGPLLMASLTDDPALVAGAVLPARRLAGRLEAMLGPAMLLRAGLVVEAASQLSLALTRALGTLLGGLLARALGITAPFWVAATAMALLAAVAWRRLTPAAIASPG